MIRVLACKHQEYPLWGGTFSGYDNRPAVEFVNALPTGAAIHDNRYLNTGTHHQKIAVVGTAGTLTAWSGGMDLNPDRLADSLTDRKYHDVQVRYPARSPMTTMSSSRSGGWTTRTLRRSRHCRA